MALLGRKQLLEKEKLTIEKVDLGNGDFVYVTQMTARARDKWEQSLIKKTYDKKGQIASIEQVLDDYRSKLAVFTVCDESGVLIFEPGDYNQLSINISASKLEKIINVAQKLNAITEQDKEELVKNSGAVPDGNSNLDSVEN